MDLPDWAPDDVETERPSAARVYDYLLGGSHNFAVDREAARMTIAIIPDTAAQAQANRAFLHRTVRYLVDQGVRQFLDVGSGVPTVGNVHEVAQKVEPDAKVVYVDIDPVAVAHSRRILAHNPHAAVVQEDLLRPEAILEHPDVRGLLNFDEPIALLLVSILHAITDEHDPYGVVGRLGAALPAGSYLVLSHISDEGMPAEWARITELSRQYRYPIAPRSRADVRRFFAGFELVDPGVVWVPQWRPEHPDEVGEHPERASFLGGAGRKP
jgi:hypothetical protein